MNQDIFEWTLLLVRWLHITVAVTWIGTSIFFMWLDRNFKPNPNATHPGHVGEVWMVHGGGFYHVEKLLMGPTKVPEHLHWFKWESYWTWLSGTTLIAMIFYTGDGTFLLDPSVSSISYGGAVAVGIFSLIGSWFFYDFVWELNLTKNKPMIGHFLTLTWLTLMSYTLCHTFSGRAAYIHIGGMIGTWMTANVFMRIIPRQVKMVEAARKGEPVNTEWGKNAKNRSTHNTYFTLPVIFIMLSNHFPQTYGSDYNWIILLGMCLSGAMIREYFVKRIDKPSYSKKMLVAGLAILFCNIYFSISTTSAPKVNSETHVDAPKVEEPKVEPSASVSAKTANISGVITFTGTPPKGKKLNLPSGCSTNKEVYSDEVIVKNGKLQNVMISVTKGLEGKTFAPTNSETISLNQINCQYKPRVVAIHTGQKIDFINSDPIFHNIRSVTTKNKMFNLPMPKKDQKISMSFDQPEMVVQSKCSIHPWMGANIGVFDHPFYDVSNESGEFNLKNLPDGKYTITAWHEVFGTKNLDLEIKNGESVKLDFNFSQN